MTHATWDTLVLRADLLRRLRRFFEERRFTEVETPLLSRDTVVDRHLDPIPVTLFSDPKEPASGPPYWLQTSPEFAMKRLLVDGAKQIFQVTRAFRSCERGQLHNPEFTMVEWYRVGDDLAAGINLLAEFTQAMFGCSAVDRLSYADAFQEFVGIDPHSASTDELADQARRRQIVAETEPANRETDEWLNLLLTECVEPRLGIERPLILYDYPASQSALARVRNEQPPVAERFELYVRGVELANGYHELLDPTELRRRNQAINKQRAADGKYTLPEDSQLLSAMEEPGLPPCCGVALGFDRLVMQVIGAQVIDEVLAFPIERA